MTSEAWPDIFRWEFGQFESVVVDKENSGGEDTEQHQRVNLNTVNWIRSWQEFNCGTFFSTLSLRMQFLISCSPPSLPTPSGISIVPRYPTWCQEAVRVSGCQAQLYQEIRNIFLIIYCSACFKVNILFDHFGSQNNSSKIPLKYFIFSEK